MTQLNFKKGEVLSAYMEIERKRFVAGFAAIACAAVLLNVAPAVRSFLQYSGDAELRFGFPYTFVTGGGLTIDTGKGGNYQFSRLALGFDATSALVVVFLAGHLYTKFRRR